MGVSILYLLTVHQWSAQLTGGNELELPSFKIKYVLAAVSPAGWWHQNQKLFGCEQAKHILKPSANHVIFRNIQYNHVIIQYEPYNNPLQAPLKPSKQRCVPTSAFLMIQPVTYTVMLGMIQFGEHMRVCAQKFCSALCAKADRRFVHVMQVDHNWAYVDVIFLHKAGCFYIWCFHISFPTLLLLHKKVTKCWLKTVLQSQKTLQPPVASVGKAGLSTWISQQQSTHSKEMLSSNLDV